MCPAEIFAYKRIINANGLTFLFTTAPAPMKAYSPISIPQIIVELAPRVTPSLIFVLLYSFFLFISGGTIYWFIEFV